MEQFSTEKFKVKNLDCTSCAAKIERGLNKQDGMRDATIDFANLTLHITTNDIDKVIKAVNLIEPAVELIPHNEISNSADSISEDAQYQTTREFWFMITAVVLFVVHLLSEEWFHAQNLQHIEILIVLVAYLLAGWNVLLGGFRTIRNGTFFDENVLMVIATGGAIAIHAYSEAIGVMIFYKVGELLQEMAVSKSRRSIKSLLAARPDKAMLKTSQGIVETSPEDVNVGDEIIIRPGEKVPLDGEIISGESQIDTSPITGEFKPVRMAVGDTILAGQVNQTGALTVKVTRPFAESSIAKMMDLVENAAARKAKTEKFITTFARYYTPVVVFIAAAIAFLPPLVSGESFQTWIYRALVLLVISCPCALVVSIPLGYFGGIGRASRQGILVKGSNFIDVLAGLKTVVFDKTGTLTQGVFKVKEIVNINGYSTEKLLEFAAAAEYHSNHPIATSILEAFSAFGQPLDESLITEHNEIAGEGVQAKYKNHKVIVGSDQLLHTKNIDHDQCDFDSTVVQVVVDNEHAGYLMLGDEIKPEAGAAVQELRKQGVDQLIMLTGDNHCAAEAVAYRLKLDQFHSGLLPEEKVSVFEQISHDRKTIGKIAFVGDGINDAPVIARSDVGVAMGALGSDAAIETADVVLMTDSPSKMAEAVTIARNTRKIVWQNIGLAFFIKGIFITFGAFGLATMWEAVFADMGTALVAVFNSTRVLGHKEIKNPLKVQSSMPPELIPD